MTQGFGIVVEVAGVVDGTEMMIGIFIAHLHEIMVPVFFGQMTDKAVLVGQAPPDITAGGQAGDDIVDITVVGFAVHGIETVLAVVVGTEQDHVGLDAEVAQSGDLLVQFVKEYRV